MPGQRRFALYGLVVGIVLLFLWHRPTRFPSVGSFNAHQGASSDSKAAQQYAHTPPQQDNKAVPVDAPSIPPPQPHTSSIAAVVTSTSNVLYVYPAQATASPPTSAAAHELVVTSITNHLSHTSLSQSLSHTLQKEKEAQGLQDLQQPGDAYAYLAAQTSIDEYAYMSGVAFAHASELTKAVQDEQDMFAYLSATTSVDEFAYLTAEASSHTAVPVASTSMPHAASATPDTTVKPATGDPNMPVEDNYNNDDYWFFQDDLNDVPLPKFDVQMLKTESPHNYKGPGHESYACFLSTRNNSLQDPYFLATLQQAYRLLWDPRSMSKHHPLTVFVAPHIPQVQRDYLAASGAIVRELALISWQPTHQSKAAPRWKDMFSKLNFWNETEYSRLLYLDTDATPLVNIDELFNMADSQHCNVDELPAQERLVKSQVCDYTLLAAYEKESDGLNAGMLVLQPNPAMHKYLLSQIENADKFDQNFVEQGFLNYAFRQDGPFPVQLVDRVWNAVMTKPEDEGVVKVLHEKIWAMWFSDHFARDYFQDTWAAMLKLYASKEFMQMRAADTTASLAHRDAA